MSTAPPSAEPDNEDAASLRASQRLLEYAGRAALQMPELEVLEIWQTYTHEESIFRYDALAEPGPTVTFLSRFDMEPMWTKEAQTAWEAAAQKHTDNQKSLVVKYDTLDPHPDHFHGTFYIYGTINKLKLRDLVIDPVSLYAATWEECSATYITP
ncbi:hypothetical protein Sste5346_002239 [Sporothrix stenoceras]|uniref:DUF6546 domain-containing protein n=1 Tax=Sporothrix stenoceras TaxID=5173 RepID=A0ABR3ZIJ1_9PEZI